MKKVVVIENETNQRKMINANLTASGYQVFGAADGDDGLRVVWREHPDLVLLDVRMPKVSGWEVLSTMKASPEFREIPVVVMTASARGSGEARAKSLGASGYLSKPFSVAELLGEVRRVIGE